MLVIRFNRVGRHNHAQYRLVVQEKTKAPSGKHIAIVGSYDPHSKQTVLKEDMIKKFLANGAQPSDSVYNLLVRNDIIKGEKRTVKLPEKKVEEKEEGSEDVAEEKKEEVKDDAKEEKVEEKKEESKDEKTEEKK
ncbi:MAG: 30S ribosomal protein S16 [Candidatus Moraniibacteriota bacterium]|jgi:small subunit ribosomal protein S16